MRCSLMSARPALPRRSSIEPSLALEAQRVFDLDNQTTLANRFGQAVAVGRSVADIDDLPKRMQAITLDDIKRVANTFLDARASVTGTLTRPPESETSAQKPAASR